MNNLESKQTILKVLDNINVQLSKGNKPSFSKSRLGKDISLTENGVYIFIQYKEFFRSEPNRVVLVLNDLSDRFDQRSIIEYYIPVAKKKWWIFESNTLDTNDDVYSEFHNLFERIEKDYEKTSILKTKQLLEKLDK